MLTWGPVPMDPRLKYFDLGFSSYGSQVKYFGNVSLMSLNSTKIVAPKHTNFYTLQLMWLPVWSIQWGVNSQMTREARSTLPGKLKKALTPPPRIDIIFYLTPSNPDPIPSPPKKKCIDHTLEQTSVLKALSLEIGTTSCLKRSCNLYPNV